jgi:hypothetical protein
MLATAGRACVLSTYANRPPVSQTAMSSDLLQTLNIITKLGSNVLCKHLRVFARLEVLLSVQEPQWNLELTWVLNNSDKLFNLICSKLTSTLVDIDFCLFADQVGETATDTTNLGQTKDDIALSFNVGVKNTQNVLKFGALDQRSGPVCNGKLETNISECTRVRSVLCIDTTRRDVTSTSISSHILL